MMSVQILRDSIWPILPAYRGSDRESLFHLWKGRKGRRSKSKSSGRRPNFVLDQGTAGHDCYLLDSSPAELSTARRLPDSNKDGGKHYASPEEIRVAGGNDPGESKPNKLGGNALLSVSRPALLCKRSSAIAAGDILESGKRVRPIPAIPVEPRQLDLNAGGGGRTLSPFIPATPTPTDAPGKTLEHQGVLSAHNFLQYCDKAGGAYGIPGEGVGDNCDMWL